MLIFLCVLASVYACKKQGLLSLVVCYEPLKSRAALYHCWHVRIFRQVLRMKRRIFPSCCSRFFMQKQSLISIGGPTHSPKRNGIS